MTRFKAPTNDLKALSSNSPDLNQWYFIAVNFKKPHVNVYFYPNLEASGLFNTSTIFSEPLKIGSSTSKFIIDGIRIYSKALTTDEIKILYENYTRSF
ncbi:MAG: LamG-like jellyroll fold domain-containing protein [Candidatus Methanomethyliaceae archaeon]